MDEPLPLLLFTQGRLTVMAGSKATKHTIFQKEWEEEYFCVAEETTVKCLICKTHLSWVSRYNIKRHFEKYHHTDYGKHILSGKQSLTSLAIRV